MKKNKLELEKFRILSLKETQLIVGGTASLINTTQVVTVPTALTSPTEPTGDTGLTGPTGPGGVTGPNTDTVYNVSDPSGDRPTNSSIPCQGSPNTTVLTTG